MQITIFLILFFALSCNSTIQEKSKNNNHSKTEIQDKSSIQSSTKDDGFDIVKIDSIADISKGANEQSPAFIKQRLEALVGNFLKEKCLQNGIHYPPKFIMFRCFKLEREFEVWAGNSQNDSLRRILFLPICAVDALPGTKLQMGDGKTPEGFYNSPPMYGSSFDFMWIKLNNSEINTYGSTGYGSSFKMDVDYPNTLDRQRTKTILKGRSPGGDIRIHGNCVTAGCISFKNRNLLPIFLANLDHNSKAYGPGKTHIFPFRFEKISETDKAYYAKNVSSMKPEQALEIWKNLEEGYNLFNKTRKALRINIVNNKKYSFASY